jgi:hypothetical protein
MKQRTQIIFTLFFSIFFFQLSAQKENEGIDSINNISWSIEALSLDSEGKINNYEKFEYYLTEPDRIVILIEGETAPFVIITNYIPAKCMNYELIKHLEYPKNAGKGYVFTKEDSLNSKYVIDTIFKVVDSCVEDYYSDKDHKTCTLTLSNSSVLSSRKNDDDLFYLKSKTLYYYDDKHNYEFGYYEIEELNGILVKDNFRLKYEGWWKFGVKHGKWKEYDKTGKLTSIRKYKKGKLIRSKTFN